MFYWLVNYAKLPMGYHEIKLHTIIKNKFILPVSRYFEQIGRLLDDCFVFFVCHAERK